MAEEDALEEPTKKKGMLVPLLIGVLLAAVGGGGGFWAATQGPLASEVKKKNLGHFAPWWLPFLGRHFHCFACVPML